MKREVHLRDVSVGVKTEDLGRVVRRKRVDVVEVALHRLGPRCAVAWVELEVGREDLLGEVFPGERRHEVVVKVVRHASAVLHFPNHVPERHPRYSL